MSGYLHFQKKIWLSRTLKMKHHLRLSGVKIKEERVNPEPRMTVNKIIEKFFN